MRLVYIDEAGISNISDEPYVVVAGFILNADQDWQAIDRHLKSLMRKHLPEVHRYNGIFHALDIFHGKRSFNRHSWPPSRREALLLDLAGVPAKFHLPVVFGYVDRKVAAESLGQLPSGARMGDSIHLLYGIAFRHLAQSIEWWMKNNAQSEVSIMMVEDTKDMRGVAKAFHYGYSNTEVDTYFEEIAVKGRRRERFEPRHIVDAVYFAQKKESPMLQVADVCAFAIKRALMNRSDTAKYFEVLKQQLVLPPAEDLPYVVRIPNSMVSIVE